MNHNFKGVEEAFRDLKRRFDNKEISRREFLERLKKLRLRDEQGRFWMIGAQSGLWYYFDGKDWVQANRPTQDENINACPHCGFTNAAGIAFCEGCGEGLHRPAIACPSCGRSLDDPDRPCPDCNRGAEAVLPMVLEPRVEASPGHFVVRRLDLLSMGLCSGGFGLVFGVIFGAFSGSTNYFSWFAKSFPAFFLDLQGTLRGGIVYAAAGAILGFAAFGLIGGMAALLFNIISSFVGGVSLTLEEKTPQESSDGDKNLPA